MPNVADLAMLLIERIIMPMADSLRGQHADR
jgi:hypothetical protein